MNNREILLQALNFAFCGEIVDGYIECGSAMELLFAS